MNADEIVRALRESLPPKIDYAELVGAEGFAHGACYVWDDPLPYLMSDAADLLESQQARIAELEAQLAASQRRERAAVGDLSTYKDCGFCVHIQDQQYCYKNCQRHVDVDNFRTYPCWQWRGPQAGKGAEHD